MPIHDMLLGLGGVTHQGLQSRLAVSVSCLAFSTFLFPALPEEAVPFRRHLYTEVETRQDNLLRFRLNP